MKKILVTGANGGLGKAVCEYFVRKGFFVYRTDVKSGEELNNSKEIIADVTDAESVKRLREEIEKETDNLSAIINVAGIFKMNSLAEIPESDLKKIFEVNFFGAYRINKEFLPFVKQGGRIIIVTSEVAGLCPLPFESIYGLTKSLLDDYAKSLRLELSLLDIPVSIVRPGAIRTELLKASTAELDKLCQTTELYSYNADKFRKIVDKTEGKSVPPEKVAKVIFKAATAKKPKLTYKINNNKLLKLLNALPERTQIYVIKKILKPKKEK